MARTDILPEGSVLSVSLDRYQELLRLPEAAFNGLNRPEDDGCYDCNAIWKQTDRDGLALAIMQSEEMREQELGYNIAPKYRTETYDYGLPLVLKGKFLIEVGSPVCTAIQLAVPVVLRTIYNVILDPVIITLASTALPANIVVTYPGETVAIHPSKVTSNAGIVTIEIPRSRLVDPAINTNCEPAPRYDDDANFLTEVDIYECVNDPSQGAFITWYGDCKPCYNTVTTTKQLAFTRITDKRLAILKLHPASYDSGTGNWTIQVPTLCCQPDAIEITYKSGKTISSQVQMDTIRLAHTLLPAFIPDRMNLCLNCWTNDIAKDPGNLVTPYGTSTGAVAVWMTDSRAKIGFGGKFPRLR